MIAVAESKSNVAPGGHKHALDLAREVLRTESEAVAQLVQRVDAGFARALDLWPKSASK